MIDRPAIKIPPGYIEVWEAAERLGVSRETILQWLNRGKLTEMKVPGLRRRFVSERSIVRAVK